MSRCFPYPPPGFEPRLKNDHVDLLHKVQENYKEKKQKKEKKDKDKREGKEKRENDKHHSKEKHREDGKDKEKKEKREKHKHKKKEKGREKESEKDKHRAQSVLLPVPTEKTSEDSSILSEHYGQDDEEFQAGSGCQFMEKRVGGTSNYGSSEEGMTSASSPEEGMIAKRTVPSASNPNVMNSNSLVQRKSNGPPNQVVSRHGTGLTERRVVGAEAKKPVPSPLNSLQAKSKGPTSQSTNHHQLTFTGSTQNRVVAIKRVEETKRVAGNSVIQMQSKTGGATFQVTDNHHAAGLNERRVNSNQSTITLEEDRENDGLNLRGGERGFVKQEEAKKKKRKERDEEKAREKELRRLEKKQRKEREKRKEIEGDKAKEVGSPMMRHSIEGPRRNIEKVRATDGFLSKKRKERESNGFFHEDDLQAQKLARTSPLNTLKRKDASTNGSVHQTDVRSTKLTKKLPPYPPPLENGRTSNHPSPLLTPPVKLSSSSPTTTTHNVHANINTIKAEVSLQKKALQLNGTVPEKRKEQSVHPDLKYLNVVYSVPKLEEKELVPPLDDQGWIVGTKPNHHRKVNSSSMMLESGLSHRPCCVWDRSVLLDLTDTLALPYVIPF
ncbi:uncharacterized protein LOC144569692 [Carex rostrata]